MAPTPVDAPPPPRGAIILTVVALVALNLAAAYVLAVTTGARPLDVPSAAVWALALAGAVAAALAVVAWRGYVRQSRLRNLGRRRS